MRCGIADKFENFKSISDIQSGSKCGPLEEQAVLSMNCSNSISDEEFERSLAVLNTIIAITGLYFGQGEDFAHLSET